LFHQAFTTIMSKPVKKSKREPLGDYGLQASVDVPDGPAGFRMERVRCVSEATELQDGNCVVCMVAIRW
jgi:hypothetical protein